jgi:hypothetical protein
MANYSLVSNAVFEPFSFERYIQPYQIYGTEFKRQEDAYGDYSDKAEGWENKIDDSVSDQYNSFKTALKNGRDRLMKEGLNSGSRSALMKVRSKYNSDIVPIEEAYKYKQTVAEEQRKAKLANPDLMFDVDFDTPEITLRELIDNPTKGYKPVDGKKLYEEGVAAATAASSRRFSEDTLGKYAAIRQGYSEEDAKKWINQSGDEDLKELQQSLDKIISGSGVTAKNKDRAMDYAIRGIKDGMATKMDFSTPMEKSKLELAWKNYDLAKEQAEAQNSLTNAKAAATLAAATGGGGGDRVSAYSKPINFDYDGTVTIINSNDDYKPQGKRVNIIKNGDEYQLTINGEIYATYNSKEKEYGKKFTLEDIKDTDKRKGIFDSYIGTRTDKTNKTIKEILKHVENIVKTEGPDAYNNYDFYLGRKNGSIYNRARLQSTPYSGGSTGYVDDDDPSQVTTAGKEGEEKKEEKKPE